MLKLRYVNILLALLFLMTSSVSLAQHQSKCDGRTNIYRDYKRYIPDVNFPELTIKLNFIFLQRDDGSAGFSKDDPEHMEITDKIMQLLNRRYGKLKDPKNDKCYKGDDFVEDTKIRFHLNDIIEIRDEYAWNLDNGGSCPNDGKWYLNKIDTMLHSDPKYTNCINIYFPNSLKRHEAYLENKDTLQGVRVKPGCSQFPSIKKLQMSSRICLPNYYTKYLDLKYNVVTDTVRNKNLQTWDEVVYFWFWEPLATGIAHELGHSLGLYHSNEHHRANKCHFSIMNQKHSSARNYLPPTELGKIHRNMRMSNIRNFLLEEVHSTIPWVVNTNFVVDIDYKVYEDIIIKSGSILNVNCNLEMSPESKIIIEDGGVLDLTYGTITGTHDFTWKGIETTENKKCFRKNRSAKSIINPSNISGISEAKK